jgi:hypothetical protein
MKRIIIKMIITTIVMILTASLAFHMDWNVIEVFISLGVEGVIASLWMNKDIDNLK